MPSGRLASRAACWGFGSGVVGFGWGSATCLLVGSGTVTCMTLGGEVCRSLRMRLVPAVRRVMKITEASQAGMGLAG